MLINFSNHPSDKWLSNQWESTLIYGKIVDIPFPSIDPMLDLNNFSELADKYILEIKQILTKESAYKNAVHIMGELTFCFTMVVKLQKEGITCIASTAKRNSNDMDNGTKNVWFYFVRFREYPKLI